MLTYYMWLSIGLVAMLIGLKISRKKSKNARRRKVKTKPVPLHKFKAESITVDDGKTMAVTVFQKKEQQRRFVRLYGITVDTLDKPLGREAKQRLDRLCAGKKLKLVVWEIDAYRRFIAEVYVGRTNLNAELVKLGLAECDAWFLKEHPAYRKALAAAQANKLGRWA